MNDLLTPHFARWEFVVSNTATRRGIDNTPPPEAWLNLHALALTVLEPARAIAGPIRVSSGYRSPELNAAIGGAKHSQHMLGEAADLIPYGCTLGELFRTLHAHTPFDQLIWEYGSWCHVSYKLNGPQRGEALLAWLHNGTTKYAPLDDEQIAQL